MFIEIGFLIYEIRFRIIMLNAVNQNIENDDTLKFKASIRFDIEFETRNWFLSRKGCHKWRSFVAMEQEMK